MTTYVSQKGKIIIVASKSLDKYQYICFINKTSE